MRTVFSLVVLLSCPALLRGEEPKTPPPGPVDAKQVEERVTQFLKRQEEVREEGRKLGRELGRHIEDEINSLHNHPWAGEYYSGNGLDNPYLAIAPRAGFLYRYPKNFETWDFNYGPVSLNGDTLILSLARPSEEDEPSTFSKKLVPVAWGERRYLVPAVGMVNFCNCVNGGYEPRREFFGSVLLRHGDEKKKVTGFPSVPKQFQRYLLARPVEAEIIAVGKPDTTHGREVRTTVIAVTVKHAENAGLLPGMELHVVKPWKFRETIELKKVGTMRSEGVITQYRPSGFLVGVVTMFEADPAVGWKLSTRAPWADALASEK